MTEAVGTGGDAGLADALAERALGRATATAALAGLLMGTLALLFLVMAGGTLDARSIPPVLVLGIGQLTGLVAAGAGVTRLRAVRFEPGTGPGQAAGAADLLRRLVVGTSVAAASVGVGCTLTLRPFATAAFSAVLAFALLTQFLLVLFVQRRVLLRASVRSQALGAQS